MSEPFVGEIRMFGGNFAPRGWALCDGQLLAVSQNDALFSLFGTIYGGDGRSTFGLPELRGRIPLHLGTGPGLSPRAIGAKSGSEDVTLSLSELPAHTHACRVSSNPGTETRPPGNVPASDLSTDLYADASCGSRVDMNSAMISPTSGGGQKHTNLQPFLCVNFIVALFGVYPSRN